LRKHMDDFIAAYNQTAHPFEWKKQVVFQKHPRKLYANFRLRTLARISHRCIADCGDDR
jgi:hypothetical protein